MKRHHTIMATVAVAGILALTTLPTATAQAPVANPVVMEHLTPRTASYGLFTVGTDGVDGNLQVTGHPWGGTRFIVTLTGITPGEHYPAALYLGDCGPDRPLLLELQPVGGHPNDPFVSVTDTPLPIGTVEKGDYFLYVFTGDPEASVVSCGEVGADANQ